MRYILFIAAFFISSLAYGQGTWNKASTNNAWNRTKADSVAIVPRDTSATNNAILPSTGQPVGDYGRIQAKHGLFYFHDSIRNRRMAFYDDMPDLSTVVKYADTSAMLVPYLLAGDTVYLSNRINAKIGTAQLTDSLNNLNLERVTTTGSTANVMSRELITDGGSGFGRLRLFTSNGVQNRIYSMSTNAGAFRPLIMAGGGLLVSNPSGSLFGWDGTSSLQVQGKGSFTGDVVTSNGTVTNVLSVSGSAGVIGTTTNHSLGLYTNNLESFRAHRSGAAGSILIPSRAGSFLADDAVSALMVKGPQILARTATTGGVYPHLKLSNESGLTRWELGTLATEGGSNTGFDLLIRGYDNSGTLIGTTPFYMRRDDGSIGLGTTASAGTRLTVNGTTVLGGNATVQGTTEGFPATAFNHYVTQQQVTDTLNSRFSSYSPAIPTWQQTLTAGNVATITPQTIVSPALNAGLYNSGNFEAQSTTFPAYGFHKPGVAAMALYLFPDASQANLRIITSSTADYRLFHEGYAPTLQQVTTAGSTTSNTVVIGNHTLGTSRILVNSAIDDGSSALQVEGTGRSTGSFKVGNVGNNGYIGLSVGSAATSGYVEFYRGASPPTRIGYIGFDNDNLNYAVEGSAVHKFTTSTGFERMRIAANGNVGINNTSPATPLDVNGTITAPALYSPSGSSLELRAASDYIVMGKGGTGTFTYVDDNGIGVGGQAGGVHTAKGYFNGNVVSTDAYVLDAAGVIAEFYLLGGAAGVRTTSNHPFVFVTNNIERGRFSASGDLTLVNKLGVGTTTPTSSLHVKGSFAAGLDPVVHTSNFTVGDYHMTRVNNGSGTIAVTLPAASTCPDRIIKLKITSNANAVTVDGNNVNFSWAPTPNGPVCEVWSDGTNWIFVQGF